MANKNTAIILLNGFILIHLFLSLKYLSAWWLFNPCARQDQVERYGCGFTAPRKIKAPDSARISEEFW